MEWWLVLLLIFGSLIVLMASGVPVAFAFMLVNVVGVFVLWGGEVGLHQLTFSLFRSLASFVWLPVPMFVLMGEIMFLSGMGKQAIDALDNWLGRLPGRLGLLAVASGTLLSTLTGSSIGSIALLGKTLVPDMEERGYKKPMSLGPILGSGGLAMMIPPSLLAVILAATAEISVGRILIGGIVPGLLMAFFYASYIIIRCKLQPSIAPPYQPPPTSLLEKIKPVVRYVLPLGFIVFAVTGVIFLGMATPSEAAATGALASLILAFFYKGLNWEMVKKCLWDTINITTMVFAIIMGSKAFSQILAFSGASANLAEFVAGLPLPPLALAIAMQIMLLILGMFMGSVAVIMVTVPIFMPLVYALGFNPIWFGLLMLLNMEMGQTTPPYGMLLFTMKGVAPPDTTLGDIIRAALPFLYCDAIVMALMIAFPNMVLWLPGLMR